ncbi:archaetidylserine synthase [Methanothermobacter wolfeii]|uniref:Archaetidylserine synthase n=1 Tax=Methanothermobacter wolfeii TaxID=145261 RepID=A0A9E7ULB9_METWO|nr:archaetidylserine synthase [Methanothermobacter wolfeii]NLM02779.1 CDP-diacylglycerol--serine O-phosphatidyltransferase [Methanothermobacter wolfeii]UXH31310.1 archaetidylserine synthase [Methanothermobacter wolfeii]SCM58059.1 Archaetidylserine synthase [Methanothermobacter wolfeii]
MKDSFNKEERRITSFIGIPDIISMLNASSGYLSIILSINGFFDAACILMLTAMIFDSMDGWFARRSGRTGTGFGKNIDSLSDIVSFGVAPAIFIYSAGASFKYINISVGLLIVLCGILRLSRFNVLTGGVKNFTGLPIPVAALMLSSFYLTGFYSETAAAILMLAVSILMVSSVEYPKVSGKSALMVLLLIMVAIITGLMTGAISGPVSTMLFIATIIYIIIPITSMRRDLNAGQN